MSTSVRLKALGCATAIFAQGLASVVAFADPLQYPRSPANASRGANDAQFAAANRKAEEALATAQRALVEAQEALRETQRASTPPESAPATGTSTRERSRTRAPVNLATRHEPTATRDISSAGTSISCSPRTRGLPAIRSARSASRSST